MAGFAFLWTAGFSQVVWDRGAGNNQWGAANNWNPNGVPTSASNVQFNATPNITGAITLDGNRAANSLTFNNVDDSFSITNGAGTNTLRLTSRTITRTAGSSGNQTLSFSTLAPQNDWDAGWTWNISGTGSLAIASTITGGYGDNIKSGNGTLVLSGNNTFSGITKINQGVLVAASDTALGSSTYGNVIASGAALHLQNNITLQEDNFQVSGTGISGTGAIRNLSGDNTLNSSLTFGAATTLGSDAGSLTVTNQLALSHDLTTTGAGNVVLSGSINNSGAITQTGTGTLTLSGSGSNSFGGALNVNSGTVVLGKTAGTNAVSGSAVNVGDGSGAASSAVLRLGASNQIADYAGTVTVNADGLFDLNNQSEAINLLAGTGRIDLGTTGALTVGINSGSSSFAGSLLGTGTFTKAGSGTLTLTSDLTFNGTFNLAAGTLKLSDMTLTLGTLNLTGNSTIDFSGSASSLLVDNLNLNGFSLNIVNWSNAADFFYATNWNGAVFDSRNAAPMNQITFNGFAAASTMWQGYDRQVTPVPESSVFGAMMMVLLSLAGMIRRYRPVVR